jgi:hypothetical protein
MTHPLTPTRYMVDPSLARHHECSVATVQIRIQYTCSIHPHTHAYTLSSMPHDFRAQSNTIQAGTSAAAPRKPL